MHATQEPDANYRTSAEQRACVHVLRFLLALSVICRVDLSAPRRLFPKVQEDSSRRALLARRWCPGRIFPEGIGCKDAFAISWYKNEVVHHLNKTCKKTFRSLRVIESLVLPRQQLGTIHTPQYSRNGRQSSQSYALRCCHRQFPFELLFCNPNKHSSFQT